MPMFTAEPFFFFSFLSPIFCSFAKKVNPWCLQLNLFYFIFVCAFFLLCWESILLSLWIWHQDISSPPHRIRSSTTINRPPPPLPPAPTDEPANYILLVPLHALLPPNVKWTGQMCLLHARIKMCLHQLPCVVHSLPLVVSSNPCFSPQCCSSCCHHSCSNSASRLHPSTTQEPTSCP
jgi:hypothetical protein